MRVNKLGRTSVEVTELGFGSGPLGGLFEPLDDDTAAGALKAAWDGGVRYYDTSPHYGIGHSERRTGEFLRTQPRSEYTLSTKVGRLLIPQDAQGLKVEAFEVPATHRRVWDFTRDGVRRSVEDSLERMVSTGSTSSTCTTRKRISTTPCGTATPRWPSSVPKVWSGRSVPECTSRQC